MKDLMKCYDPVCCAMRSEQKRLQIEEKVLKKKSLQLISIYFYTYINSFFFNEIIQNRDEIMLYAMLLCAIMDGNLMICYELTML